MRTRERSGARARARLAGEARNRDRRHIWQSAIGDAIFQITGKRFRDLPYSKHDLRWS